MSTESDPDLSLPRLTDEEVALFMRNSPKGMRRALTKALKKSDGKFWLVHNEKGSVSVVGDIPLDVATMFMAPMGDHDGLN